MSGEGESLVILITSLEQWKDTWDAAWKPLLESLYYFSPEYEGIWSRVWRKYDELKALQLVDSSSTQSFAWQSRTEEYRAKIDNLREEQFQPIGPEFASILPLWVHCDKLYEKMNPDRVHHWNATQENWLKFRALYEDEERQLPVMQSPSLLMSLSESQRSSFLLLRGWWDAEYCSRELLEATRAFLRRRSKSRRPLPMPTSLEIVRSIMADKSYYHQLCFELFIREFNPLSWEPNTRWPSLGFLNKARFFSSCISTAQCLSRRFFPEGQPTTKTSFPEVVSFSGAQHGLECGERKPRWLWSVQDQKTIEVSQLAACPQYACVSHTWGRWRRPTATSVPGVDGWLVPENDLYDVQSLPDQLRHLPFEYVWLDLFCIPQDGSPDADEEIAHQSAIFKGSKCTVAWIHDINSWENVSNALRWLCLRYIKVADRLFSSAIMSEVISREVFFAAQPPVELMHPRVQIIHGIVTAAATDKSERTEQVEPSAWFSSLWTLQEAVLFPDMVLYSKNWQRLEDPTGQAVTLKTLATLLHIAHAIDDNLFNFNKHPMIPFVTSHCPVLSEVDDPVPSGVKQLLEFRDLTRLDDVLLSSSAVNVMFNANIRQATGSRAPAIMSALGITDWYTDLIRRKRVKEDQEKELVRGIFPLAFVREAATKIGATFFETSHSISLGTTERRLHLERPCASMLPFFKAQMWANGRYGAPNVGRIGVLEHPAVATWLIEADGTVRMRSAGILTCTHDITQPALSGSIFWFGEGAGEEDGPTDDFCESLKRIASGRLVYAVELYKDGLVHHGVLLLHCGKPPRNDQPTHCVKVGNFWTVARAVSSGMAPSSPIYWIVL